MPRPRKTLPVVGPAGSVCAEEVTQLLHEMMGKRKPPGQKSRLEEKVASDLAALGLMDGCERQYRFHPTRRWKIDFAWPKWSVGDWYEPFAIEVNGGTYLQGRHRGAHSRGSRQRQDYEKWSEMSLMGWTLLLVDSKDVKEGRHVELVLRAMGRDDPMKWQQN